jgi:site-specific recombinase XerC
MKKPKEKIDMNELTTRTENDIRQMAQVLATFPEPGRWTQQQKDQAINFAALLETAQKMIAIKTLAGIDYRAEREKLLHNAGKTDSAHTRIAYRAGLDRLEEWAAAQGINVLELTPAQADDFGYSLRGNRAAASIRLDIAACSSFFTRLHKRHTAIENPFKGSEARPKKKVARKLVIPTAAEVETMIRELPAYEAAAAAVMAYRGLRVGALPGLSITGGKFFGFSKGKDISGNMPENALDAIRAAMLLMRGPFAGELANTLEKRIARAIGKLHKAGKIQAGYSAHDLRHFYAVTEYRRDRDVHRISKLLGHASITVTENYLRGLGEVE